MVTVQRAIERRIVRRGLVEGAVAKAVRALGAKADMGQLKHLKQRTRCCGAGYCEVLK